MNTYYSKAKNYRQLIIVILSAIFILCSTMICFAEDTPKESSEIFTVHEYTVDCLGQYFTLDFQDDVNVTSVTSSNISIVSFDDDDIYRTFVYLYAEEPGTVTITARDSNGNTDTCKVTVLPPQLVLSDTEIELDTYDLDNYNEDSESPSEDVKIDSDTNRIKSVRSSDNSIVKCYLTDRYEFSLEAVSAGSAVITVTDEYNQTATVTVTITQKYINEKTYLPIMQDACKEATLHYGENMIKFQTDISSKLKNIKIEATLGGKTYTAKYSGYEDDYYTSVIKGIPVLPVGTKIVYTLSKDDVIYTHNSSVKYGNVGDDVYVSFKKYYDDTPELVYTGKKQTPAVDAEYWYNDYGDTKRITKGVDYTVKYTNNLNVGLARVTITGKGNYKGSTYLSFKIIPKGTSIVRLTSARKAFKVKWKKQAAKMSKSRITGYQIRYSKAKSMSKAIAKKVKGYSKVSKKISKLKARTRYYVQVRTYKVVKGKTYYSKWSAKKYVKTK